MILKVKKKETLITKANEKAVNWLIIMVKIVIAWLINVCLI